MTRLPDRSAKALHYHTLVEPDWEASVMSELEEAFGARVYTARDAEQAEPLEVEVHLRSRDEPDGLTYREIGHVLGLSAERVRQIELRALAKCRDAIIALERAADRRIFFAYGGTHEPLTPRRRRGTKIRL